MIKAKQVMEHLHETDEKQENLHREMRDMEHKLDTLCLRTMEVMEKCNKITEEVCRLEAMLAMWQRRVEQTLIKEGQDNGT